MIPVDWRMDALVIMIMTSQYKKRNLRRKESRNKRKSEAYIQKKET
jgi:hypothetical protein